MSLWRWARMVSIYRVTLCRAERGGGWFRPVHHRSVMPLGRRRSAAGPADFVLFGPVFSTPGKGPAIGLDVLRSIAEISTVPVYALGGITRENAESCIAAGAAGIAAIRMFQILRLRFSDGKLK